MNEDELIAQSAAQAIKTGQNMQMDRTERDAAGAGLSTRGISDGEMDTSWRNTGSSGGDDPYLSSNADAKIARRAIIQEGEMSMADLLAPDLNSGDAVARDTAQSMMRREKAAAQFTNHVVNQGAQRVVQDAYMNPTEASMLMEQEAYSPMQSDSGWRVKKQPQRLKNGKQIAVFIVEDALTGMNTGQKYRISAVAEKIAAVLSATQNLNDPRIQMIETSYKQHVDLMRSLAEAKRTGNQQKVSIIESKLQSVNAKLGLA
jgi:hypothetical protein